MVCVLRELLFVQGLCFALNGIVEARFLEMVIQY